MRDPAGTAGFFYAAAIFSIGRMDAKVTGRLYKIIGQMSATLQPISAIVVL
jgi:hypothetical protein